MADQVLKWAEFRRHRSRIIQVKTIETARRDLAKGDRDRLIEVTA